ncbi:MAG: sporulation integral membrane protein YtvI [Oscillospiraceae bacterium]|jgi:sporulation integral membrane protein YtvI|nr:sporulation integral membrane protein YtvI [Oscillospiraceae bacterium]
MEQPSAFLSPRAKARLERMIDVGYYLLIIAAFYFFMRYAFWLVFPFLFSFVVAVVLQKPMNFAYRKFRMKKSFTSVMLVLLFYLLIILIISLIGARIWASAKGFIDYITTQARNLPKIIKGMEGRINGLVKWMPDAIEVRINDWLANFTDTLIAGQNEKGETVGMFGSLMSHFDLQWLKAPMNGVLTTATKIPALVIAVVITVISSFFMTSGYDDIKHFIKRQLKPEHRRALSASKRIMTTSSLKLVRAYAIILSVSFCETVLGLLLLRLIGVFNGKYLMSVALLTCFADFLPVLGVGSILTPWALYNLIMGNVGMGVGLLAIWLVIIFVRQIIEPKLVAANLGLPPIAAIAGMYIGLQLFGFLGMVILPLLLILLKLLNDEGVVHIWKSGPKKEPVAKPPPFQRLARKAASKKK